MDEMNEKLKAKIDKIKEHLKNNKEKYYIGASCFIAGAVAAVIYYQKQGPKEVIVQGNEGGGNNLAKCNIENYFYQTISKYGNKLGHPGNAVVELDKFGNVIDKPFYHSQALAAKDAGVNDKTMMEHLNGKYYHLNGRNFVRLSDLVEQWAIMTKMLSESKAA